MDFLHTAGTITLSVHVWCNNNHIVYINTLGTFIILKLTILLQASTICFNPRFQCYICSYTPTLSVCCTVLNGPGVCDVTHFEVTKLLLEPAFPLLAVEGHASSVLAKHWLLYLKVGLTQLAKGHFRCSII